MPLYCDPHDLVESAKCFQCMTRDQAGSVGASLLCLFANADRYVSQPFIEGEAGGYIAGEGSGEYIEPE